MPLTDEQVTAVEAALSAFAPDSTDIKDTAYQLQRACREYGRMLRGQTPDRWKIQLAQLERLNADAYGRVLKTLPTDKQTELHAYVMEHKGSALPVMEKPVAVTTYKQRTPPVIIKNP